MNSTVSPPADPRRHHLVITGTGRAGTTFLVRLLTELGYDTGYRGENWRADYSEHCAAGLEHTFAPDAPYVVKSPEFTRLLPILFQEGRAPQIDHVLIPIRDLESAAKSRIRIGGADGEIPGGLWMTSNPEEQAEKLAVAFHELLHVLAEHDIPHTLLAFPRFASDADYTFWRLRPLLKGANPFEFTAAFARVSQPELIHTYTHQNTFRDDGTAAKYRAQQRQLKIQKRAARKRRRWLRWATSLAAVAGVSGIVLLKAAL